MKSRMAGALNLCFSIFKGFLLSAPFFRGLRRQDSGNNEEKSFTKLWALDCWFSRTKSSAFFALKKGAADWRYDMNEELTPQKERFLREVEQKLLRRDLDAKLLEDGLIHVRWNEKPPCSVDRDGIVRFRPADKVVRVLRGIFNAAVDNNLIAKSPVPAILRIGGKATQEDAHR